MTETFSRALSFAAVAHDGQKRKGSGVPYIVHPVEAALLLVEAEADEEIVIAGLLHDTCEDTGVTSEQIEKEFGSRVRALVEANTEDKSLSWEERKAHTIRFVAEEATRDEMLLICADKLSNAASMLRDYERIGDELWSRFKRGRAEQEGYYRGLVVALSRLEGLSIYKKYIETVNRIFG